MERQDLSRGIQPVQHALIIAAGRGSRFGVVTDGRPKPLIEVHGVPLLRRILASASEAGIRHFTVVTGYEAAMLEDFLHRNIPPDTTVRTLRNYQWERSNGISVLCAKRHLPERFALLMADHLFDSEILKRLMAAPLPAGHCRLAVDFHPEKITDLADATKVRVGDGLILNIGKKIRKYNAVDTGIFLCSSGIFPALEEAVSAGKESLSDGIKELARQRCMEAMDIGSLFWQDVDDEASRQEAERRLAEIPSSSV